MTRATHNLIPPATERSAAPEPFSSCTLRLVPRANPGVDAETVRRMLAALLARRILRVSTEKGGLQ
jgi:hypothetical protein